MIASSRDVFALSSNLTEALLLDQARECSARSPAFLDQTVGMRAQGGDRAADRHRR
jgi:hypothetical protein